jgi:hypothetical protein
VDCGAFWKLLIVQYWGQLPAAKISTWRKRFQPWWVTASADSEYDRKQSTGHECPNYDPPNHPYFSFTQRGLAAFRTHRQHQIRDQPLSQYRYSTKIECWANLGIRFPQPHAALLHLFFVATTTIFCKVELASQMKFLSASRQLSSFGIVVNNTCHGPSCILEGTILLYVNLRTACEPCF